MASFVKSSAVLLFVVVFSLSEAAGSATPESIPWWEIMPAKVKLNATDYGSISTKCMDCICKVEGCESQIGKCQMDVGSLSCGPFQIKLPYWVDCGKPGGDWQGCTKYMGCSRTCVGAYMKRYGARCTGGRSPTCQDYARIHNGGPQGCKKSATVGYWKKVKACCDARGGC